MKNCDVFVGLWGSYSVYIRHQRAAPSYKTDTMITLALDAPHGISLCFCFYVECLLHQHKNSCIFTSRFAFPDVM